MRYLLLILVFMTFQSHGQEQVYVFSYFTDNGQDGLHLAYSKDGLTWESLKDGKSLVVPTVGNDKLMRDPFILQG